MQGWRRNFAIACLVIAAQLTFQSSGAAGWDPLSYFKSQTPSKLQLSVQSALTEPIARVYSFFARLAVLPILNPLKEVPGDIYADLLGGSFLARKARCFPKLKIQSGPSILPTITDASQLEITGDIHAAVEDAKLVGGNAGLRFVKSGDIAFDKVTASTTTPADLQSAFLSKSKVCQPVAHLVLGTPPVGPWFNGIILATVWTGTIEARWAVQTELNGKVGGSTTEVLKVLDEYLKKITDHKLPVTVDIGAEVKIDGDIGRQIVISSAKPLPIAWLPAYVSKQHLAETLEALKQGKLERLQTGFLQERSSGRSNADISEAISEEADFPLPAPMVIAAQAASPPYIAFDSQNEDQLRYISAVNDLLALSYELNVDRESR
jgi:hypothetical protein